jgi:UDP-N-acetylmuramoylalanine--D-glutamate ligase
MQLSGKRILVLGLGISGRSAAEFLAGRGARVVAADERPAPPGIGDLADRVELRVGQPFPDPAGFDLVVPSPGVPVGRYQERARRVAGDVEIAFQHLRVPVVAVTGTNGKSTTTRLVEAMLRAGGLRAAAAGNLGDPALGLVGQPLDVAVLEVSSFQLETVETFRPRVAVVLNVTEDHLDRHGSFAAYRAAKARIFENQGPGDSLVLNADDPVARSMAGEARARVWLYSLTDARGVDAGFDAGAIVLRESGERLPLEAPFLPGLHNRGNVLAALLAVTSLGVAPRRALGALGGFRGLPHRTELVARHDGVTWVDDSKATNPGAAREALQGFPPPIVWIAGGKDKGLDFGPLAETAASRVRVALLIGQAAGKLAEALRDHVEVTLLPDLASAVREAARLAKPGDVVLLAPACASFDQFQSYVERGERFQQAVRALLPREEARA